VFEFMVPERDKDCYGRDSLVQTSITVLPSYRSPLPTANVTVLPQSVVLFFFSMELATRFVANGTMKTLRKPWNAFDAFVLGLSVLLVLYKIVLDYIIVQAPYPPASPRPAPHTLNALS
jgi:hypothetical protein